MKKIIDSDLAKSQLEKINKILDSPHILIGGLAVQQYHKARDSKDIDLICDNKTAKLLINKLYPSKDYKVVEQNDDDYRPSFEITHKIYETKVVFFGPKITERGGYTYIDLNDLQEESIPFSYKGSTYENVRIPRMETLAFTKLLSFVNRIRVSRSKGEKDLLDFINLTNQDSFKFNILIDHIRKSSCQQFLRKELSEIKDYNSDLWESSLFVDFMAIMSPVLQDLGYLKEESTKFEDNYERLYKVEENVEFYNLIATKYDERNTKQILSTHKNIITTVSNLIDSNKSIKILDLGGGTGRLIAFQFLNKKNIEWHCVDSSKEMLEQFDLNLKSSKFKYSLFNNSIFEIPEKVLNEKYDVVIISCVLTSLDKNPSFKEIVSIMKEGGSLILADIHPCLTLKRPFYDFEIEGSKVALTPRMVYPLSLINKLQNLGTQLVNVDLIDNHKGETYSYVLNFQK